MQSAQVTNNCLENKKNVIKKTIQPGISQYVITIFVISIILIAILFINFYSSFKLINDNEKIISSQAISKQAETVNNFILKGLDVIQVSSITMNYLMDKNYSNKQLQAFLTQQSEDYTKKISSSFTGVYGYFNNEYLDGSNWIPDADYVATERPWYIDAIKAKGETAIVSPYLDEKTKTVLFSISKLLNDNKSVMAFDISLDELQKFSSSISLNGSGYGFIIDKNGMIVAHPKDSEIGKNYAEYSAVENPDLSKIMKNIINGNNKIINHKIKGINSMIFSKKIYNNWYLVLIVPCSEIYDDLYLTTIKISCLSLLILILVIYFCIINYNNRVTAFNYISELSTTNNIIAELIETIAPKIQKEANTIFENNDDISVNSQNSEIQNCSNNIENANNSLWETLNSIKNQTSQNKESNNHSSEKNNNGVQ
ncbi:MAG: cache domain-containing protein [Succinivibrionaceae bacterium]